MEQDPLEELVSYTDRFFSLISALSDSTSRPRDYGTGKILNMVEVHTLAMIASTPGITPTQIAQNWNRTLSAASRNIDRLQRKGYVRKEFHPGNRKTIHLYPTEPGEKLARLHAEYDAATSRSVAAALLERHSMEELRTFSTVLESFTQIVKEEPDL